MHPAIAARLAAFHARTPIRTGSLIISLFGDAILPRGGAISLNSLLEILRSFGLSDGLVRTALSRLVAEGWFERWKVGRNSFYRLSDAGREASLKAAERIYGAPAPDWTGIFDLVLLEPNPDRDSTRSAFLEAGYGSVAPGVLVGLSSVSSSFRGHAAEPGTHGQGRGPSRGFRVLASGEPRNDAENDPIRLSARPASSSDGRRLAERAWPIGALDARHRAFVGEMEPLAQALQRKPRLDPLDALVGRVLVIHDWRRVVLKDPGLPAELLPEPWAGAEARRLCARLYGLLAPPAEHWLDQHAATDEGPLPAPEPSFQRRFEPAEERTEALQK